MILGVSGLFCFFYSIFDGKFCKQTVETLIRCHIMWPLIWVWSVLFAYDSFTGFPVRIGWNCWHFKFVSVKIVF